MAKKNSVPLLYHPRYPAFVARYAHDPIRFMVEVVGLEPTDDQLRLLEEVNEPHARVSVSSGHGTGKSSVSGVIVLWHLLAWAQSNTVVVANTLSQIKIGVLKEAADMVSRIKAGPHGWIADYIEVQAEKISIRGYGMTWWVLPKTAPPGKPEALAGQHRHALLWVVDEASAVSDAALGVIGGSLTGGAWNRMLMMSQPTRTSGLHYESHHKLSRGRGGIWANLVFNSEMSPLVSDEFIKEKVLQYGGRDDPLYMIKVLGQWPDQTDGFLLGRSQVDAALAMRRAIPDGAAWGWVVSVDVATGGLRDKSVVVVAKVFGWGLHHQADARRVHIHSVPLCSNAIEPKQLAGEVRAIASTLPGATVLVDVGGVGVSVYQSLRDDGVNVTKVRWGDPPWKKELRAGYFNQRALAMVCAAEAMKHGHMSFNPKWTRDSRIRGELIDQASRIPYHFDEKGRYTIYPKHSKEWEGLPSPDIFDAVSFLFLDTAEYVAAVVSGGEDASQAHAIDAGLDAALEEDGEVEEEGLLTV